MKKIFVAVLLCLALVLSAVPGAVFATHADGLSLTAEVNPEKLYTSDSDQTVTVTIKANQELDIDAIGAFIYYKSGETAFPVQSVTNAEISAVASSVFYDDIPDTVTVAWTNDYNVQDSYKTTNLLIIEFKVPGGTPEGTYTLKVGGDTDDKGIYLSNNYGTTFEDEAVVTFDIVLEQPEVPTATAPTGATLTYNGSEQTGVEAGEGYTLSGVVSATDAGTYTATATLADGYVWSDEPTTGPRTIEWTIERAVIEAPKAEEGLTYNGETQTGVPAGDGYTITGNTGTDADSYTATATADSNHIFEGEKESVDVPWVIGRAVLEDPKPAEGLVYNGSEQTGLEDGEGYTVEAGGTGTDAGSYTAQLQADKNHTFSNGTQNMTVDWEIAQAKLEDQTVDVTVGGSKDLDDDESLSYEAEENDFFTLEGNTVTGTAEGEGTITVVSDGSGNYERGEATITVKVTDTPPTGDMTGRYIVIGSIALVALAAYLFITRRKEQE